jgi:multidrug resistance efflux pump
MADLSPIPRPAALRAQDLKQRLLPWLMAFAAACGVYWLWDSHLTTSFIVGEVQPTVATIASPEAGRLVSVAVDQFDTVTNGQLLVSVQLSRPGTTLAEIEAARTELLVTRARMLQDENRNRMNYQTFRADVAAARLALELAKIRFKQAESEYQRTLKLVDDKVMAAGIGVDRNTFGLEVAQRDRDALQAEVAERTQLVAELEAQLGSLRPAEGASSSVEGPIEAALQAREDLLKRTRNDLELVAPTNGMITAVTRHAGEYVAAGEALVTLSCEKASRIVGFVRQPIGYVPQPGDKLEIRSRGQPVRKGVGEVLKTGPKLEMFSQPLRARGFDTALERGVPILVSIPDDLKEQLRPGELIDLIPRRKGP